LHKVKSYGSKLKLLNMQKVISTFLILVFIVHLTFGQWTSQNSGTNQDFWAISMGNDQVGYAGGGPWQFTSSCVLSKTEDGGQTWIAQNPVSFPSCIFGVDALNSDTVFAVGCNASYYYGLILRSFNGGQTWTTKNISNTWGFYCVEFPTEYIGYTCGWNGRIYKTEDAGDNWNSVPSGSSQVFRRMSFINENLGFAACGNDHASTNKIYKTINGNSWSLISNFGGTFIIGGMYFFDENTGVVAGTNGSKAVIKRTTDGGLNWEDVLEGNYTFVLECLYFDNNIGWAAGKYGSNNGIFRSEDGGLTWELHFSGLTGTPYSVFKQDTTSFIAGTSGMIMKYTESQITQLKPEKIKDSMIYPNPANKSIYIDINEFPEGKLYSITAYNGTLIKSGEITGSERVNINVENWPKGLYILSVWSKNNENRITKKFIVN